MGIRDHVPAMGSGASEGRKSLVSFARNAPSLRQLARSFRSGAVDLHAILPSTAVTGESLSLTLQAWDRYERIERGYRGRVEFEATDPAASLPTARRFDAGDAGWARLDGVAFDTPGVHYVSVRDPDTGLEAVSNPVRVTADEPAYRVYWGDIHLHSKGSDGVAAMAKGFRFGRDVMALDVVAYTDHDTMGFFIPPSLQRRRMHGHFFRRMASVVDDFDDAGSFVTLPAYEWTKQPNHGGHVNVYFESTADAELLDSRTAGTETYEGLWAALREWRDRTGGDVVTIPHHPAEAMYPFDFSATEYDDELAPLVEVYSQWGSSEHPAADGNELAIGGIAKGEVTVPGHHVRDALRLGNRVGLLASSDYHGPHPGHSLIHVEPHVPRLSDLVRDGIGWGPIWRLWDERSYPGGLTAFLAPELTRSAIFRSLKERRVYGTTQPDRILVDLSVAGRGLHDADSEVTIEAGAERDVEVEVAGTAPIDEVVVVKNADAWRRVDGPGGDGLDAYTASVSVTDDAPITGVSWDAARGSSADVYYVRVRQVDGGTAWAGPIWVEAA